jgi:hypothetical protein
MNLKAFVPFLFLVMGCSHAPPSPMRNEALNSSSAMRVAIFNKGTRLDRTALEACTRDFSKMEVLDETYVHRAARDGGVSVHELFSLGDRYAAYSAFREFELLLIAFRSGDKDYLRIVNNLGGYVSTVVLDIPKPTCKDIFSSQRIVLLDSVPPFADVSVDGRKVGEAPRWVWLKDGTYKQDCTLTEHTFKPVKFSIPTDQRAYCQREATTGKSAPDAEEKMSVEEGAGSVLMYIAGAAGTIAAILIPLLLFL